jgi:hypothetical protein
VDQNFAQGRLSLQRAQATYDTALDSFKLQLGLPPVLPATLDSEELRQFELNDPRLELLTAQNEETRIELLQYSENELPAIADIQEFYAACEEVLDRIPELSAKVESELELWRSRLQPAGDETGVDEVPDIHRQHEAELATRLTQIMGETSAEFPLDVTQLRSAKEAIDTDERLLAWQRLNTLCGDRYVCGADSDSGLSHSDQATAYI